MRDRIRLRFVDESVEVFEADQLREHLGPDAINTVARMFVGYSAGYETSVHMRDRQGRQIKSIGLVMPDMSGPTKGRPEHKPLASRAVWPAIGNSGRLQP